MTQLSSFAPTPSAAPAARMLAAQTGMELRLILRNGEQLLLTIIIPTLLLVLFSSAALVDTGTNSRVDFLAPGIIALAVMSTAFTGQAIATGFERRYGVLKRLGATALPRWALLSAKTAAVLAVEALQIVLLIVVAALLGWSPSGSAGGALAVVGVLLLATATFSGLGLLMAGSLEAGVTLAAANLVYIVLLVTGGVVFPLDKFPSGLHRILEYSPLSALSDGLRSVLQDGGGVPLHDVVTLAVWAIVALGTASLTFRWE